MKNQELLKRIVELFQLHSFSLDKEKKAETIQVILSALNSHHDQQDETYRKICSSLNTVLPITSKTPIEKHPFIPVSLFKSLDLKSIANEDIYKTIHSSGTSTGYSSTIHLDKTTASLQQKALVRIVSDFVGLKRSPMLIVDKMANRASTQTHSSVRTAILGFSLFASETCYALDEEMNLQIEKIQAFLERNKGKELIVFGFTFQIWLSLVHELNKHNLQLDLSKAVLIHGGGWKKTLKQTVNNVEFRKALQNSCRLSRIYNYYGMIEQSGNILLECEQGYLHSSIFGDVIIRNPNDFSVCEKDEPGIIQMMFTLSLSYCGHNLLTSDEGILRGEDDCKCGRKGKYIEVIGRFPDVEPKGCSDV